MNIYSKLLNEEHVTCPSCKGKIILDHEKGEKFCSNCGIIVNAFHGFDETNHKEFFANIENSGLEPTALMMYDTGLPTFIGKKNVDASGKQINSPPEMERLRKLNHFIISNDSRARNLNKASREIQRITEILGMNSLIAERASYIYKKALSQKLIRGRSIAGIVAATICIACKDMGIPFAVEKMENLVENCNKKSIMHYYKLLLKQLKINVSVPIPTQHISKIATQAKLSGKTERTALKILSAIEGEPSLSGKKPVSLAAAALYLSSLQTGEHTTQLRIAIAAGLTTITIRKRYLEIIDILKQRTGQELNFDETQIKLRQNHRSSKIQLKTAT